MTLHRAWEYPPVMMHNSPKKQSGRVRELFADPHSERNDYSTLGSRT